MPRAIASRRAAEADLGAIDQQPPAVAPVRAGDHARQLAAAGAEQAGNAQHFAGVQRQADV